MEAVTKITQVRAVLAWAAARYDGVDNGYCVLCHGHRTYDEAGNVEKCVDSDCKSHEIQIALALLSEIEAEMAQEGDAAAATYCRCTLPGVTLTLTQARALASLLGHLQEFLGFAIKSEIVPGTDQPRLSDQDASRRVQRDRRRWQKAEEFVTLLDGAK